MDLIEELSGIKFNQNERITGVYMIKTKDRYLISATRNLYVSIRDHILDAQNGTGNTEINEHLKMVMENVDHPSPFFILSSNMEDVSAFRQLYLDKGCTLFDSAVDRTKIKIKEPLYWIIKAKIDWIELFEKYSKMVWKNRFARTYIDFLYTNWFFYKIESAKENNMTFEINEFIDQFYSYLEYKFDKLKKERSNKPQYYNTQQNFDISDIFI